MNNRKISFYLFIFFLAAYSLFSSLRIGSGDGETIYKVANTHINGRGLAIEVTLRTYDDPFGACVNGNGYF